MSTVIAHPAEARVGRGRGLRITAGIVAALEAVLAVVLYVIVAALLAPTASDQAPLAIGFALAVVALGWTATLVWRGVQRTPISAVVVLVGWAANLFGLVYLIGTLQAVAVLAAPLAVLTALLVLGTLPIVIGSKRAVS